MGSYIDGKYDSCDKVCLGAMLTILVSSPVTRVSLLWLMKLQWRRYMTNKFILEDLSLGK